MKEDIPISYKQVILKGLLVSAPFLVAAAAVYLLLPESNSLTRSDNLRISTKRNGVAAFGFYSGWFNLVNGKTAFVAVSVPPIIRLDFSGHLKFSVVAFSGSDGFEKAVSLWAMSN